MLKKHSGIDRLCLCISVACAIYKDKDQLVSAYL